MNSKFIKNLKLILTVRSFYIGCAIFVIFGLTFVLYSIIEESSLRMLIIGMCSYCFGVLLLFINFLREYCYCEFLKIVRFLRRYIFIKVK